DEGATDIERALRLRPVVNATSRSPRSGFEAFNTESAFFRNGRDVSLNSLFNATAVLSLAKCRDQLLTLNLTNYSVTPISFQMATQPGEIPAVLDFYYEEKARLVALS